MKKYLSILSAALLLVLASACSIFEVEDTIDPNNASLESILQNATPAQINQLGVGLQASMRNGLFSFYTASGTVGREIIVSTSTESRNYTELLGLGRELYGGTNDPAGIFNGYYNSYSQTRRRAEMFIRSAENTSVLTEAQKEGVRGFANTVKAFTILNLVNMQGANGVRSTFTDLSSPGDMLKPGPFTDYAGGLALAQNLLTEAKAQLLAAGNTFAFTMTSGYTGFSTPSNFLLFNRALAAKVFMYQGNFVAMNQALGESFLNVAGTFDNGPKYTYSTAAGDAVNPIFQNKNTTGAPIVVFNQHITEAEAGDTRVVGATAKVSARMTVRASGDVPAPSSPATHEVFMYASNTASIPIIRNEELILMAAEGQIQTDNLAAAEATLNVIRAAYGLQPIATAKPTIVGNKDGLIDELLHQRRYSLFFEGHRWFDAKRYNKIATLPLQSDGYGIFPQMAKVASEVEWDIRNPQ
jgi:starch-binding outer membrane protein, SusD/RagB family